MQKQMDICWTFCNASLLNICGLEVLDLHAQLG